MFCTTVSVLTCSTKLSGRLSVAPQASESTCSLSASHRENVAWRWLQACTVQKFVACIWFKAAQGCHNPSHSRTFVYLWFTFDYFYDMYGNMYGNQVFGAPVATGGAAAGSATVTKTGKELLENRFLWMLTSAGVDDTVLDHFGNNGIKTLVGFRHIAENEGKTSGTFEKGPD